MSGVVQGHRKQAPAGIERRSASGRLDGQGVWGDSRALGAPIGPAVAAGPVRICFVATPHHRWLHASRRLSLRSAVGPGQERRPCRAAPRCAENSARAGALHRHTVWRRVPGRRAISGHDVSDFSSKCGYADCIRKSRAPSASQANATFPIARLLTSVTHSPGAAKGENRKNAPLIVTNC